MLEGLKRCLHTQARRLFLRDHPVTATSVAQLGSKQRFSKWQDVPFFVAQFLRGHDRITREMWPRKTDARTQHITPLDALGLLTSLVKTRVTAIA